MAWRFAMSPPLPPGARHILKAVLSLALERLAFPLFGFDNSFPFRYRVHAICEPLAGSEMKFTGLA
jgi:hypothetical protein